MERQSMNEYEKKKKKYNIQGVSKDLISFEM